MRPKNIINVIIMILIEKMGIFISKDKLHWTARN